MINALHLLWIVPLSMCFGAAALAVVACIIVGKRAEEEWNAACSNKEDKHNAGII